MTMTSPAEGRVTSGYGYRNPIPGVTSGTFHAGVDIANNVGTNIYAAYGGTVVEAGWAIVPYRSGNGILIENPDGERQYYGHLSKILVKVGEKVKRGEHIAEMGATGNVTGPHLHFETWGGSSRHTTRDPMIDFRHWGIRAGSKPEGTSGHAAPAMPKGDSDTLAYQKRQNRYGNAGLVEDGVNGPKTKAWRAWVKKLQKALPAWKGVPHLRVDGDYGEVTHKWVAYMQERNDLVADGIAGPVTVNFMQKYGSDLPDRP